MPLYCNCVCDVIGGPVVFSVSFDCTQVGGDSLQLHASSAAQSQPQTLDLTITAVTPTAEKREMAQYTVTVYTSDLSGAGTDCTAYIRVHGRKGDTGNQGLPGRFARGSVETALVEGLNVGQMLCICVGHNDEGAHRPFQPFFHFYHSLIEVYSFYGLITRASMHVLVRSFLHVFSDASKLQGGLSRLGVPCIIHCPIQHVMSQHTMRLPSIHCLFMLSFVQSFGHSSAGGFVWIVGRSIG